MSWKANAAFLGCAAAAGLAVLVFNYFSHTDISHQAIQTHLHWYGTAVYEYHAKVGEWPTRIDDLAVTTLPHKSRYWKTLAQDEINVIVWPKDFKPNPRDNARTILVYHNKGLYTQLGRTWVCWGDLRTEYIPTDELKAHLQAIQK